MFFNKKNLKKCENCGSKIQNSFTFCPHCGNSFSAEKEKKDYGLLGRTDSVQNEDLFEPQFGFTDRIFTSVFNSLIKNLDKQFQSQLKEMEKEFQGAEIKTLPNGIRIKISSPIPLQQPRPKQKAKPKEKILTEKQIIKMSSLPRTTAKANVKRLNDKIIYELSTSGISSLDDIFVSKLESGYEVKALGDKKIYVNSIPVNLPLTKYSIAKNKLFLEFSTAPPNSVFQ